jgi:hypothetical protein
MVRMRVSVNVRATWDPLQILGRGHIGVGTEQTPGIWVLGLSKNPITRTGFQNLPSVENRHTPGQTGCRSQVVSQH